MIRIVLFLRDISTIQWPVVYQAMEACLDHRPADDTVFRQLALYADAYVDDDPTRHDVSSRNGLKSFREPASVCRDNPSFVFIVTPENDAIRPPDYVPLFMIQRKYAGRTSIGIDLRQIPNVNTREHLNFRFSIFSLFINNIEPIGGLHSLYIINDTLPAGQDVSALRLNQSFPPKVQALKFKSTYSNFSWEEITKHASKSFSPLLPINEPLFQHLFQNGDVNGEYWEEADFMKVSSEKIIARFKNPRALTDIKYSSPFERWFVFAFFNALSPKRVDDELVRSLYPILHSYYIGIYELVQNIIFHTQEEGWIYVYFCKKDSLPPHASAHLQEIQREPPEMYLRLGIYDFCGRGIIKTCNDNYGLGFNNLADIVDPYMMSFSDNQENDFLSLTYAAHLGIKTLVSSVLSHHGYISIETSHLDGKQKIEGWEGALQPPEYIDNIEGTHYDIVLPITRESPPPYPFQVDSQIPTFTKLVGRTDKIPSISMLSILEDFPLTGVLDKKRQKDVMDGICEAITKEFDNLAQGSQRSFYALDMADVQSLTPNMIFKILATLQLRDHRISLIVLYNLDNVVIDEICRIVRNVGEWKNKKKQPIWSREHAVVLMNTDFRAQILCGERKQEIAAMNAWLEKRYSGYSNRFSAWHDRDAIIPPGSKKFLLPYECLIFNHDKALFFDMISLLLNNPVSRNRDFGFLSEGVYTKIGGKLYVERFYAADTLFLNSFFVDRFAYFIASDIVEKKREDLKWKNLILIGYRMFSDLTMRRIQQYINDYSQRESVRGIIIAEEGKEESILSFWPKADNSLQKDIDNSILVLMVPVASTLTTHDKIITYFTKAAGLSEPPQFLNYCAILARDGDSDSVTPNEKAWRWQHLDSHCVVTVLPGANHISYCVQKVSRWHDLIDGGTFPSSYVDELYLNRTGDESLNSWDMFGLPSVSLPPIEMIQDEVSFFKGEDIADESTVLEEFNRLTMKRLEELKPFIYVGHIRYGTNHQRYYVDTENYVRQPRHDLLNEWIRYLKTEEILWRDRSRIPVIIAPEYGKESTFINLVNEYLFDGNALVICIDVSDPLDKVKADYSFLTAFPERFSFFFVDHAMLSAETYEKTRMCLSAICEDPLFTFTGVLTLLNRLSAVKYDSIRMSLDGGCFLSFMNLFIPPSNQQGEKCTLCDLENHYERLLDFSVIETCREVISENCRKFHLRDGDFRYSKSKGKGVDVTNMPTGVNNRDFKRLQISHQLYFLITCIQKGYPVHFLSGVDAHPRVDDHDSYGEKTVERIEDAMEQYYQRLGKDVDLRISFLKAITFPPLSQYVYIRRFAHRLALKELDSVLSKEHPDFDDFCLTKALLKSLSWMGSNALVRKKVILAAWKLCYNVSQDIVTELQKVKNDLSETDSSVFGETVDLFLGTELRTLQEKESLLTNQLSKLNDFGSFFQFCIKNASFNNEAQSFYLGELLRTGDEIDTRLPLVASRTVLENSLFKELDDCGKQGQAFIDKTGAWRIRKPHGVFLSNVYYDNTTVFRKTLANFKNEIDKDKGLARLFYHNAKIIEFEEFDKRVDIIAEKLLDIVNAQYYYFWFRLLLAEDSLNPGKRLDTTRDGIPLIRKFVYLLYIRMIINDSDEHSFEDDVVKLLRVCSAIMESSHSFITVKYDSMLYALANNHTDIGFERHENDLFCGRFLSMKRVMYPFIIHDEETGITTQEKLESYQPNRLCCQFLERKGENSRSYIGAVSYLYTDNDDYFRIKKMECSRILLLLKPDIDNYVDHCIKEKLFQLWLKHKITKSIFKRINLTSNHSLHLDGWDFEKLDIENYRKMDQDIYMLSNVVISHLFSILAVEHEIRIQSQKKSIEDIFSDKFLAMLNTLNHNRWGNKLRIKKEEKKEKSILTENRLIIHSFVVQCIDNAYTKLVKKNNHENFNIDLTYGPSFIDIRNNFPGIDKRVLVEEINSFTKLYNDKAIEENLRNDRFFQYGMTLLSLKMYCKAVNLKCKCGFVLSNKPQFRVYISAK